MSRFLIEVPHGPNKIECQKAISIFLNSGSHFLSHAEWGCRDSEHKAWFFMDAENKNEVIQVLPPAYRKDAKITQINKFTDQDLQTMLTTHT